MILLIILSFAFSQKNGIWVTRFALKNKTTLNNLVQFAITNQITDVFLQVRGRGDAYYLSDYEKNIKVSNDFNLLKVMKDLKNNNIKVHAWLNVFLMSSSKETIQEEKNHILNDNPNWIDFKNDLESFTNRLEKTDDLKNNTQLEGIYTLPIFNDVLEYYKKITSELISKYGFDGIHLDYFRLAGSNYGYHPKMRMMFQKKYDIFIEHYMNNSLNDPEIRELWSNFVSQKFDLFLTNLTKSNGNVMWSVAVKPNPFEAKYKYGQDWMNWLDKRIIDFVMPMNYSASDNRFSKNIKFYTKDSIKDRIWVGIATFNQKMDDVRSKINIVKKENMNYTLFSFNDLNDKSIKQIMR